MKQRKKKPLPIKEIEWGPLGPPVKEYNYRCSVCGTELLVNEAIVETGMKVGCPGCNNYTMKCVEPD